MKISLIVVKGKPLGAEIPVQGSEFLIGRDKRCHLRPNNDSVSKLHCGIKIIEGEVYFIDAKSTNGSFVNDERVHEKRILQNGDVIGFADLKFRVRISSVKRLAQDTAPASPQKFVDPAGDSGTDRMMEWLATESAPPAESTIVGDDPDSEPSLNVTNIEMKITEAQREALAADANDTQEEVKVADATEEQPVAESIRPEDRKDPRRVSPSRPARPGSEMEGTSRAADDLLKSYLVRRRQ